LFQRVRYDRLGAVGVPKKDVALVAGLLKLAGAERRTGDLYGTKTFSARASKMVSSLKGVENVYTQHQPLIMQTLENLAKVRTPMRLDSSEDPRGHFLTGRAAPHARRLLPCESPTKHSGGGGALSTTSSAELLGRASPHGGVVVDAGGRGSSKRATTRRWDRPCKPETAPTR
jgi:hypothetical protein